MGQINATIINNSTTESVPIFTSIDPSWTGVYFHALVDVAGTVASNNYLSVLNPVGSGKIAIALGFITSNYSGASVTAAQSLRAFRTSAHTGGTDIAAVDVNRFFTGFGDPSAQVKIGNPGTTNTNPTNPMIGIAPALGTSAQAPSTVSPTPGASFVFLPGEGIVFNVPVGDVDQLWNMQYVWAEKPL